MSHLIYLGMCIKTFATCHQPCCTFCPVVGVVEHLPILYVIFVVVSRWHVQPLAMLYLFPCSRTFRSFCTSWKTRPSL